ncbi:MAG: hypothetical protein HC905_20910 [Bacteroidales bacterium]|nr:hypothetical protein [Bacteroidales bacterium]
MFHELYQTSFMFFEKIYPDMRLNQSHVSLYMALFQFWNLNRFENPFKIIRSEAMKLSKIGSINTSQFSSIDWSNTPYFIRISVDGTVMGTNQLLSVPFALHAKEAETYADGQNNPAEIDLQSVYTECLG